MGIRTVPTRLAACTVFAVATLVLQFPSCGAVGIIDQYFTDLNDEPNPSWYTVKERAKFEALGSTIQVNHDAIQSAYSNRTITRPIKLHTPHNQGILPRSFGNVTRWYQEDGDTAIFRLFPGEDNVVLSRVKAPRVEAYGLHKWQRGDGWYEFSCRYTFLKIRPGAVFQIKHNTTYWSMQLVLEENTDGTFDLFYVKLRDREAKTLLMEDVVGSGVDIKVLDDGDNQKVFVDDELIVENVMTDRPEGEANHARWGLYSPKAAMDRDILIFVTGAYAGPAGEGAEVSEESNAIYDDSTEANPTSENWGDVAEDSNAEFLEEWYSDPENSGYGFF